MHNVHSWLGLIVQRLWRNFLTTTAFGTIEATLRVFLNVFLHVFVCASPLGVAYLVYIVWALLNIHLHNS